MLDSAEIKTENGTMIENQKSVFSDRKNNRSIVDYGMDVDYSKNNIEPFEEHSVFYFDKSVTDRELPEIIVCYKESTYHVVKDICIDEGVPSKDKFFFESSEDDKIVRTFPITIENDVAKLKGAKQNDMMNLSEENHCSEKTDNQCDDTTDLLQTEKSGKNEKENIADSVSKISLGEIFAMEKLHPESCNSALSDVNSYAADEEPSVQESSDSIEEMNNDAGLTEETTSTSTFEELNNGSKPTDESSNNTKDSLAAPAQASDAKEPESKTDAAISEKLISESEESSPGNDLCYNGKAETDNDLCYDHGKGETDNDLCYDAKAETDNDLCYDENAKTDNDFDPRVPPASGSTEGYHQSSTDELPATESSTCEGQSNELFENEGQDNHGESSFSMAEQPVSGSICYSGSIAYSGNISHRSDSSTTSTRSFAFPVLPNEWNSSPVRMAKADRRRYGKHRGGWRNVVPCCRF